MPSRGDGLSGKCPVCQISGRVTVWSRNYPVGELSDRGNVHRGTVSRGTAWSGNCSDTDDEQDNILN